MAGALRRTHQQYCAVGFYPQETRGQKACVIEETSGTLANGSSPGWYNGVICVNDKKVHAVIVENKPNIILYHHIPEVTCIAADQKNCQTLISRAGTGGGNVPLILERMNKNDT